MKKVLILILIAFFITSCVEIPAEEVVTIPEVVETECNNYCSSNELAAFYEVEYNPNSLKYECYCLDLSKTTLEIKSYAAEEITTIETQQEADQFKHIEELHWTRMPVTYFITNKQECGSYEVNKINRAFSELAAATNNVVTFKEINSPADIDVTCSFLEHCYNKTIDIREDLGLIYKYETICGHTKGLAQITEYQGNRILRATVEMIGLAGFSETERRGMSGFYIGSCGYTTTEIHEILHTFGYGHFNDSQSIMYQEEDAVGYTIQEEGECKGKKKAIDQVIVNDLIKTYG